MCDNLSFKKKEKKEAYLCDSEIKDDFKQISWLYLKLTYILKSYCLIYCNINL